MPCMTHRTALPSAAIALALLLSACSGPSAHVGVGVPVGPFSVGSGGVSAGVGTGVHQGGQVMGHAGVGASVPVGGARVGAGVGSSTVLHDPKQPRPAAPSDGTPVQWRDAQGRIVPECQVRGECG